MSFPTYNNVSFENLSMFFNCCVSFFGKGGGREGNYLGFSERVDQYQYLGNYPPTPPLTQQQSIDNRLGLMLGRGGVGGQLARY